MSRVTRWWWVRHAPVTAEHRGRLYGQSDVACDTSDAEGLAALSALLPRDAVWITTQLQRTRLTAAAIARLGPPIPEPRIEPDFAEQHFGDWQGLAWEEMEARDARAHAAFWQDPYGNGPPGGESFAAVARRTGRAIERLTAAHAGSDIVAIAHGGTIRAALALALGIDGVAAFSFRFDTLALTRIDHVPGGVLNGHGGDWLVAAVNVPPR